MSIETLWQDARFALRSARNRPSATILTILCLSLGIGANTAVYSVVRAVLLESLPYRQPERLVKLNETYVAFDRQGVASVSPDNYRDWRTQSHSFDEMAAYLLVGRDVGNIGEPEHLRGVRATSNLFVTLGARPLVGRAFTPDDDTPAVTPLVVISEGLWRRRFASNPQIVGTEITLNNVKHTVLGVMPADFDFPVSPLRNDLWVFDRGMNALKGRQNYSLQVVARLKPGIDSARATADLVGVAKRLEQEFPSQKGRSVVLVSFGNSIVGKVRPALLILLGAVGIVLLIACANAASLMLARAESRQREVAIRIAVGADRTRIVRQFLTEAMVLAGLGGVLGTLLALVGLRVLLKLASSSLPRGDAVGVDWAVLVFAAGISIATGLAAGLLPSLTSQQRDLRSGLSNSAGQLRSGRTRQRAFEVLIVGEIALSVLLLVSAGLVMRGFLALVGTDAGFRSDGVLVFHASVPPGQIADSARYTGFYEPILRQLRALPGIRAVALTSRVPIQDGGGDRFFAIVGQPEETDPVKMPYAEFRIVSSQYFVALGIPIVAGREFTDSDAPLAQPVVIINDELARVYFGGMNALGQQIKFGTSAPLTIVGVVKSVRHFGLDQKPRAELYVPAPQTAAALSTMAFVLLAQDHPDAFGPLARKAVRNVAPNQPVFQMETMSTVIANSVSARSLVLTLILLFSVIAVGLSIAGVYGVLSYAVSRRTREIGIRMALGARATAVTAMVLGEAAMLVGVGLFIGVAAAMLMTGTLRSILYGIQPRDPLTFVVVPILVGIIAMLASAKPAFRAARIDPLGAIRSE